MGGWTMATLALVLTMALGAEAGPGYPVHVCDGHPGIIGSAGRAFVSAEGVSKIVYYRQVKDGSYTYAEQLCVGTPAGWVNDTFEDVDCSGNFTRDAIAGHNSELQVVNIALKGPIAYLLSHKGSSVEPVLCKFELDHLSNNPPDCLPLGPYLQDQGPLSLSEDGRHFAIAGYYSFIMGTTDFANPGLKTILYEKHRYDVFGPSLLKFYGGRVWWLVATTPPMGSPLCSVAYDAAVNGTRDGVVCGSTIFKNNYWSAYVLEVAGSSFLIPEGDGKGVDGGTAKVADRICAYDPTTEKKYCTDKEHLAHEGKLSPEGDLVLLDLVGQVCLVTYRDLIAGEPEYTNCVAAITTRIGSPYPGRWGWGGETVVYMQYIAPTLNSLQLCVARQEDLSAAVCHTVERVREEAGVQVDPWGIHVYWYMENVWGSDASLCSASAKDLLAGGDPSEVGVCVC